jgi:phosphohistidine phosphatase
MAGRKRRLVLVRHAKSAWPDGVRDVDRPLAGRGRREAPAIGQWLREHVPEVDLVVCSTAKRATQTWKRAAGELSDEPKVRRDDRVYAAPVKVLLAVVRELPGKARTVVVVGHNPGLEELVELLTGTPQVLKTSAVAVLAGTGDWKDAGWHWAKLETLATPRDS